MVAVLISVAADGVDLVVLGLDVDVVGCVRSCYSPNYSTHRNRDWGRRI